MLPTLLFFMMPLLVVAVTLKQFHGSFVSPTRKFALNCGLLLAPWVLLFLGPRVDGEGFASAIGVIPTIVGFVVALISLLTVRPRDSQSNR